MINYARCIFWDLFLRDSTSSCKCIDFFPWLLQLWYYACISFRKIHVKSVFYSALGTMRRDSVSAYIRLCDQKQFEPRIRDHSPMTRSIFEIPSLSTSAKVHSRVVHRAVTITFSFRSGVSSLNAHASIDAHVNWGEKSGIRVLRIYRTTY